MAAVSLRPCDLLPLELEHARAELALHAGRTQP